MTSRFTKLLLLLFVTVFFASTTQALNCSLSLCSASNQQLLSPNNRNVIQVNNTNNELQLHGFQTANQKQYPPLTIPNFTASNVTFSNANPSRFLVASPTSFLILTIKNNQFILEKNFTFNLTTRNQNLQFNADGNAVLWNTNTNIYKLPISQKKPDSILTIPKGNIQDFTSLANNQLAVVKQNDTSIAIYNEKASLPVAQLQGHKSNIRQLLSNNDDNLYSLDTDNHLILWDTQQKQALYDLLIDTQVGTRTIEKIAFNHDATALQAKVIEKAQAYIYTFQLHDLLQKKVIPTIQPVQNFTNKQKKESLPKNTLSLQENKQQKIPSLYDNAVAAMQNKDFKRAFDFVTRIPETDPSFPKALQLKSQISKQVKFYNRLANAEDFYARRNNKAAKVILDDLLAADPHNKEALALSKKINSHFSIFTPLIWLFVLLLLALAFYFRNNLLILVKKHKAKQNTKAKPAKEQEPINYEQKNKEKVAALYVQTKYLLTKIEKKDTTNSLRMTWKTLENKLNTIQQAMQLESESCQTISKQLLQIQKEIHTAEETLFKDQQAKHMAFKKARQAEREKQARESATKSTPLQKNPPSKYDSDYAILELPKSANLQDLKAAFRHKMQEFHPDKHHNALPEIQQKVTEKTKQIKKAYQNLYQYLSIT